MEGRPARMERSSTGRSAADDSPFMQAQPSNTVSFMERALGGRNRTSEPYDMHSGREGSFQELWASPTQKLLVALGIAFYIFCIFFYNILANLLVYVSFHKIPHDNPSSPLNPGAIALYDLGWELTPDLSYRPILIKVFFVDLLVFTAQYLPPILLLSWGQTKRLVCYMAIVGSAGLMKCMIQLLTILPAARGGYSCWQPGENGNWNLEELEAVQRPFSEWWFQPWGTIHGCNDMIWSGHTFQSCTGLLFIDKTLRHRGWSWQIRGLLVVYVLAYVYAVLCCRMHYTVDVVIAVMISAAMFTHTGLRFFIWHVFNQIVGAEKFPTRPTVELGVY